LAKNASSLRNFKKILSTFPLFQRFFSQGFAIPEQKVEGDLRISNVKDIWFFRVKCGNGSCVEAKDRKFPRSLVIPAQAGMTSFRGGFLCKIRSHTSHQRTRYLFEITRIYYKLSFVKNMKGESTMVTAFVLINVEKGQLPQVVKQLGSIEEVIEVYSVSGRYDLVAKIQVQEYEYMSEIATEKIHKVDGIANTETIMAFKVYKF